MYYIYVIKSKKNNKKYVGYTSKNPKIRLFEHNRGCNKWSRENKPFDLIYQESFESKTEAMVRERFLKSGQGRELLKSIIPE